MNQKYDAIIIGAGILGASIAFEMAKKGYKTLNIEKLAAAGSGSTGNCCGIIRTHYSTREGTALAYESFMHWKDWAKYLETVDESGLAEFIQTGMIIIKSERQNYRRHLEIHDELGIEYEEWDAQTLKRRMPIFDTSAYFPPKRPGDNEFGQKSGTEIPGAVFLQCAGYVNDPQLSTHNVQRAAEAKGAEFLFNSEVVDVLKSGGRVTGVTLNDGQIVNAPVVVNAAGPHSFLINRMAGVEGDMKVKTRALRHEVHIVPSPDGFDFEKDGFVTSDDDISGYHRPEVGNSILLGSQDPECDPQEWIDDPDDFNREVTEEQWKAQVYRLAQRIPSLRIPNRPKGFAELYDNSDDWIPIYDKSNLAGFYMAVGTSGNQYKNGPGVGQLMVGLIEACQDGHDHDRDPVKVSGRYTGLTINLGFFSRHREVIRDSSFSVLG